MSKTIFVASGFLLAASLAAGSAGAQCTFPHPRKAAEFKASLVPAFVPCNACLGARCVSGMNAGELCAAHSDCPGGGCGTLEVVGPSCAPMDCPAPAFCHGANAATDIGISSCKPPATFNEVAGSPADGWLWGPNSSGSVSFKPAKNKLANVLNPVPNTADVEVRISLNDIRDADGLVELSSGVAVPERRTTYEDRSGGDMTAIDLQVPAFSVLVVNGRARVRTSANAWLNSVGIKGVPGCTSLELTGFTLEDGNGHPFASLGIFVPDLPNM